MSFRSLLRPHAALLLALTLIVPMGASALPELLSRKGADTPSRDEKPVDVPSDTLDLFFDAGGERVGAYNIVLEFADPAAFRLQSFAAAAGVLSSTDPGGAFFSISGEFVSGPAPDVTEVGRLITQAIAAGSKLTYRGSYTDFDTFEDFPISGVIGQAVSSVPEPALLALLTLAPLARRWSRARS